MCDARADNTAKQQSCSPGSETRRRDRETNSSVEGLEPTVLGAGARRGIAAVRAVHAAGPEQVRVVDVDLGRVRALRIADALPAHTIISATAFHSASAGRKMGGWARRKGGLERGFGSCLAGGAVEERHLAGDEAGSDGRHEPAHEVDRAARILLPQPHAGTSVSAVMSRMPLLPYTTISVCVATLKHPVLVTPSRHCRHILVLEHGARISPDTWRRPAG